MKICLCNFLYTSRYRLTIDTDFGFVYLSSLLYLLVAGSLKNFKCFPAYYYFLYKLKCNYLINCKACLFRFFSF